MIVRAYNPESDVEPIARLFHDTIHAVNRADYSREQIEAWAPAAIDLLFVHAAHQRQGIANVLYQTAEQSLRADGVRRLFTHASITAQPFFTRCGFNIVKHQTVEIRGVVLANAVMEKQLAQ